MITFLIDCRDPASAEPALPAVNAGIERLGPDGPRRSGPSPLVEPEERAEPADVAIDELATVVESGAEDGVSGLLGGGGRS